MVKYIFLCPSLNLVGQERRQRSDLLDESEDSDSSDSSISDVVEETREGGRMTKS